MKATASAHSMVDVIPFFSVFIILLESNASIKPKEKLIYFTHNRENSIRNIVHLLMFQCHSKFGRAEVLVWSPTKKNKETGEGVDIWMGDHLDKIPCAVLLVKSSWRSGHQSRLPPLLQCCMWIEFQSIST